MRSILFVFVYCTIQSCTVVGQITDDTEVVDSPFAHSDWIAAGPESENFDTTYGAPYFRRTISVEPGLVSATAYVAAGGYFTFLLDDNTAGDRLLDPAVTRYDKTVQYVTFDITDLLTRGSHTVGAVLANGFYNVDTESAWDFDRAPWRNRPALRMKVVLAYTTGDTVLIGTDANWQYSYSPITFNQLRNGEHYDARRGYDDWQRVTEVNGPAGKLVEQRMPPIKKTRTLKPVAINEPEPGVYVVDFGQNIAGWAGLRIDEPAGTEIRITYGERLHEDGTLDIAELSRFIKSGETQTTRYTASRDPAQYYEPWTTYFGFQYVEIEGLSQAPTEETIEAFMIHTALDTVGRFETSNELINQLHENIRWSYLGNYHSFPEDCPHREKMGWTGDAQLVIETGLFNFDVGSSFDKWLSDFRDEQPASGALPGILPTSGWGYEIGHAGEPYYGPHWEGAAITIPWQVYRWTGDTTILADNYPLMRSYLGFLESQSVDHLLTGGIDDHKSLKTSTPGDYLSSAYYHWLLKLTAEVAQVLAKPAEAAELRKTAGEVHTAFQEKYFDRETTSYGGGGQTPLAVALGCDLVPEQFYGDVLQRLIDTIRSEDYHFDAGVVGVKKVIEVLMANDRSDILYEMATKTDFPSFGNWVEQGANTMWQNWDGSQSRNHIMFGSIGDFFYQGLAGIRPVTEHPGFERILLTPYFADGMDFLTANHETPYGMLETGWEREEGNLRYIVTVPPGTQAELRLKDWVTSEDATTVMLPPGKHTLILTRRDLR